MRFFINSTATANGSNETALLENKPMSKEAITVIYKLGMSAIVGAVCITAIKTAGVWGVVVVGVLALAYLAGKMD